MLVKKCCFPTPTTGSLGGNSGLTPSIHLGIHPYRGSLKLQSEEESSCVLPCRAGMGYAWFGLYLPTGAAQHWGRFFCGQAGCDHRRPNTSKETWKPPINKLKGIGAGICG